MVNLRLARMAMATRFELVLEGEDEVWLRAAGEEALSEIERLDAQLSIYRPSSELSRINGSAGAGPVRVEPRLFSLLQTAKRIHAETDGAFDLTVAPLMRAWGFFRDNGRLPDAATIDRARSVTGMDLVELDPENTTVHFRRDGVMLDPGAIGKGFAVDEAMRILTEAGVEAAFLHGGTSTMSAIGTPSDGGNWRVAITFPGEENTSDEDSLLTVVPLCNSSVSVSAVWGRAFEAEGRLFGHVLDPRLGRPVEGALLTAVEMPSATEADAYSTALLVLGEVSAALLAMLGSQIRFLSVFQQDLENKYEILDGGLNLLPSTRYRIRKALA